jgi:transposase
MTEIIADRLHLAKNVLQAHGADASGRAAPSKNMTQNHVLAFFGQFRPCVVAVDPCSGAHFWGLEIGKLGHEVRLIPPA